MNYSSLKNKIVTANNLHRCDQCGNILLKSFEDYAFIKRKDIELIAQGNITIVCPRCELVTEVNLMEESKEVNV